MMPNISSITNMLFPFVDSIFSKNTECCLVMFTKYETIYFPRFKNKPFYYKKSL